MTRTFHSIGQGAFYTEVFESGFIAVYDCGGSNKQIIEDEIRVTFPKDQKIDIVFISHLHNDHINGLKFLLNHCNVKKVVLPLLTDAMKIWFVVENAFYAKTWDAVFVGNLIISPEILLGDRIVFVEQFDNNTPSESLIEYSNLSRQIKSGTKIKNEIDWIYIPVNFNFDVYANRLKIDLGNKGIYLTNIIQKIQTNKQDILNAYKKVLAGTNNFNANSMTVYSGGFDKQFSIVTVQNQKFMINEQAGCLYLGDFDASEQLKLNGLKNAYAAHWKQLSTVQIPHHGSRNNFHNDLAWSGSVSVVSTSFRYNHPSAKVTKEIAKQNSFLALVTTQSETKTIQCIKNCKIQAFACCNMELRNILIDKYPECFL